MLLFVVGVREVNSLEQGNHIRTMRRKIRTLSTPIPEPKGTDTILTLKHLPVSLTVTTTSPMRG